MTPERLLHGLNTLATTLANHPKALALLALGSCGLERGRLDGFSDLDFFVIVEESAKSDFVENLDWLTTGAPLVFTHRNTVDGWKTLDADGVLCEFAVFHPGELANIPFAPGQAVWAREGFDVGCLKPQRSIDPFDGAWMAVEALTNILVGLKRHLRGEEQAARRALIVPAAEQTCAVVMAGRQGDPYNPWRRLEQLDAQSAARIDAALQAKSTPDVARGLIGLLSEYQELPPALIKEINQHLALCDAR